MKAGQQRQPGSGAVATGGFSSVLDLGRLEQGSVSQLQVPRSRIRTYEELDGADGRSVFFRPHRYTPDELAPLRCSVSVTIDGRRRDFPLLDVSQSGLAVAWPADLPLQKRQRLAVTLRIDAYDAFRGDAHVGSIRDREADKLVGLSFHDFFLDIDELLHLRSVRAWSQKTGITATTRRPWALEGGERFQARVGEMRLLLEDGRRQLDALEKELPWHMLRAEGNAVLSSLVASLRAGFVGQVVQLGEQIDAAVRELPGAHGNAEAVEWSRRYLDDLFLESPACHRARFKPFGYPGDYEVMNFIYERWFEGPTLFSRAMCLAFTDMVAGRAVRYRKDLVKRQVRALLANRGGSTRPVRLLSIAAGSAQELFELLGEVEDLPVPLEVVLFEQDKNALTHSWRRLKSVVDARFPQQVRLTFLHDSIKRLLRDANLFGEFGKFDLIYSCGLFDYLAERTAVVLTRNLARSAHPGGQLLIANMVDHPTRWFQEHHLDWHLIYRTRDELLDIGRRALPDAPIRLLEEETGANPFFELVRP